MSSRRKRFSLIQRAQPHPKVAFVVARELWQTTRNLPHSLLEDYSRQSVLEIVVVESSDEIVRAARHAASLCDVVVAVGGDGTVSRVATGIFGTGAALGIVPIGSTNITAKSLGVPDYPRAAIELLLGRHTLRAIDVGRCENRCFLHIAGAGFDAEIFRLASLEWKRRLGWIAYLPPALRASRSDPPQIKVTVDDVVLVERSPLVLVANGGSFITPRLRLIPGISYDDGWLDVLVFTCTTTREMLATLALVCAGQAERSQFVTWVRGQQVRIVADPPVWVELDGDPIGQTPREFVVVPKGLHVVTPLH